MVSTTQPLTVIFFYLAASLLTSSAESPFKFESTPGKLPKDVVPRHYAIRLQPDLEKFVTTGKVDINIDVLKPAREIVLNALDLEITKAAITAPKTIPLESKADAEAQTVSFGLSETLAPGKYSLTIEFTGHLREQAQGLFFVRYSAGAGKKVMLATQMEATDARRMFPCWDEPVFRASFEPTVIVPKKHLTVSNMPIKNEKSLDGGLKEVHFEATPPMASYLMVLVSGELEALEDSFEGVRMRVITTEGKKEQGRYALESAKKILGYYNHYFGIKFPLPKLDQIAIPGGFGGAMENWGGITYNESILLFDPKTSSLETRQNVFGVMAHEMAHQWFGDLVTTAWWDNLWLNEGFASWMGTKATDHFNPDWQMWLDAGSAKSGVMRQDSLPSTHPILQPIANESQANDAFDGITYIKGQSFLRMLENYLGEEKFRHGMQLYMSRHRYSSTTTADLWAALEKASGKPVRALSAGWTEQPGLPVVNVSSQCEGGKDIVRLEQERFTVQDPGAKPLQWMVPVALADLTRTKSTRVELLTNKTTTVAFPNCDGVIKANFGDAGYYRVSYSPVMFQKLKSRMNSLPPEDRLNLLGDAWAMVTAQRATAASYLDLVASLGPEKTAAIWQDVLGRLGVIDGLQRGQPGRAAFRAWAIQMVRPQLQRLGWEPRAGELATDTLLRNSVISLLGEFGDKEIIAVARTRFQKFLTQPESLPPNLRPCIVNIVGHYSDRPTYDQLHRMARAAKGTEERRRYYGAMAAALDPPLAALTLPISLTDETVPQEAIYLVTDVAHSGEQPELAWKFAQDHMTQLLGRAEEFSRNMYVPSIMSAFSDADRADELEKYVKEKVSPKGATKAKEIAESIRLRAALKQRELPSIDHWVSARSSTID
ncbi:MAG TPA: M1 family metallopeptidase [Candidatus Binatia bacterium]|jgi:aminopeptidase N|nr:M1 family metallopeptidase [Candidatus Binatia bacterium]